MQKLLETVFCTTVVMLLQRLECKVIEHSGRAKITTSHQVGCVSCVYIMTNVLKGAIKGDGSKHDVPD